MNLAKNQIFVPNVLNSETITSLYTSWDKINHSEVHSVVLCSKDSEHFCNGMDLQWLSEDIHDDFVAHIAVFQKFLHELGAAPCLTICCIDGAVRGGGLGIVAACDIVIATKRSTFQMPESLIGFAPGVILGALQRRLTNHIIKTMAFSGEVFSVESCLRWGLVDDVVASSESMAVKRYQKCKKTAIADLKYLLNNDVSEFEIAKLLEKRLQQPVIRERIQNIAYFMGEEQ